MVNQPGSARSSDAAAGALREVLPRVRRHFRNALVRGDTDFDRSDIFNAAIDEGAYFAIGAGCIPTVRRWCRPLPRRTGNPFFLAPSARKPAEPSRHGYTRNWRRQKAAERGFRRLRTVKQWLSEIDYQPHGL